MHMATITAVIATSTTTTTTSTSFDQLWVGLGTTDYPQEEFPNFPTVSNAAAPLPGPPPPPPPPQRPVPQPPRPPPPPQRPANRPQPQQQPSGFGQSEVVELPPPHPAPVILATGQNYENFPNVVNADERYVAVPSREAGVPVSPLILLIQT